MTSIVTEIEATYRINSYESSITNIYSYTNPAEFSLHDPQRLLISLSLRAYLKGTIELFDCIKLCLMGIDTYLSHGFVFLTVRFQRVTVHLFKEYVIYWHIMPLKIAYDKEIHFSAKDLWLSAPNREHMYPFDYSMTQELLSSMGLPSWLSYTLLLLWKDMATMATLIKRSL